VRTAQQPGFAESVEPTEPTAAPLIAPPTWALFAGVALLYAIGSGMALAMARWSGLAAVLFIPAGLTVGVLLRTAKRTWWATLLGAGVAEAVLDLAFGYTGAATVGFVIANIAEPLVGALVVERACGRVDLSRRRHVWWFIVGAVVLGPAVGALLGAVSDWRFEGDDAVLTFLQWWLGDSVGVVLVGGAILAWGSSPDRRSVASPVGAAHLVGTVALTTVTFGITDLPIGFLVLMGVVVAGAIFGPRAVALTGLVVAGTIIAVRMSGVSSLVVGLDEGTALLVVKAQLGMFSMAGMVVAAEVSEREFATRRAERFRARSALYETEQLARERADHLAEQVLRSEERYRAVLEQTDDGIFQIDADRRILEVSRSGAAMIGRSQDEVVGLHFDELFHPDDRDLRVSEIASISMGGILRTEWRLIRSEGSARLASVVGARSTDGRIQLILSDVTARNQLWDALLSSEARFHSLFSSIDEGYCLAEMVLDDAGDPVDYRFLVTNERFEAMTGLENAVGRTARELVPDLESSWVETYGRVALEGETLRFVDHSPAMGRWFDVFATPVTPFGSFALVFNDITARHAAETELRESEERFRNMADHAPAMIWVTDDAGWCTYLNERWCEFTDRDQSEGLGIGWLDPVHPADRDSTYTTFRADSEQRLPTRLEYRLRRADGEYRWVMDSATPRFSDDGRFLGYIGSVMEIHERRQAEEALRASEQRFRELADHLPHMIWEHDATGRLIFVNETFCRYYDVSRDDMTGDRWTTLVDPADLDSYSEAFSEAVRNRAPFHAEVRIRNASGELRWLESWAEPAFGPSGEFIGHVGTSVDVTDRKRAEDQARADEEMMRRAQGRLEFVAGLLTDLESVTGVVARSRMLVESLVPRVADYAIIEEPSSETPLIAWAHADPTMRPVVAELRRRHRLRPDHAYSLHRVAAGEEQLLSRIVPALRSEFAVDPEMATLLGALAALSHLAVPLDLGGAAKGALVLGLTDPNRRPYTEHDLAFVRDIADRAGRLIASARLAEHEHAVALRLQRALLPDELISHEAVELAARYDAAADGLEVGGDWYESFHLEDGRIGIAVGDVVGHGLESAAAMGRLRSAMGALAPHCDGPGDLLASLDASAGASQGSDFATACAAMLDPDSGLLTYASAGHPPILVVDADGACRWLVDGRSPPLGTLAPGKRPEASSSIDPGSVVVLYSDGLVERRTDGFDAGLAKLEEAVSKHRFAAAGELCDLVIGEMSDGIGFEDDVVVVCMRVGAGLGPLGLTIPARPELLAGVRAEMRGWLDRWGVEESARHDVLLAVGEAAANSIEHAYAPEQPGQVQIELSLHPDGCIAASVTDAGRWREATPADAHHRGRGLSIIHRIATDVECSTGPDGTVTSFRVPCPVFGPGSGLEMEDGG
jgi:PAS domain S-box-containing protein